MTLEVNRTEHIYIGKNDNLNKKTHIFNNLCNEANYTIWQEFFHNKRWIIYNGLGQRMKSSENYKQLPAQTSQQTLRILDQSWNSFVKLMKSYPELFKSKPNILGYKNKNGEFIFTNQQCRIGDGMLKFPKIIKSEMKKRLDDNKDLREVRIIHLGTGYNLKNVYGIDILDINTFNNQIMGIDVGVISQIDQGIDVMGGFLKSMNNYFNMKCAQLKSKSDRQQGNRLERRKNNKCRHERSMIRKGFPKALADWMQGVGLHPRSIR
ncbi:MAG: hypothetical protein QXT35_00025 [Conexivisphaerales archaeon]